MDVGRTPEGPDPGSPFFPELKRKVAEFAREYRPRVILVEDKASGQSLIQQLKHGSTLAILPVKVDTDKRTRAAAVTPLIEAGKVFLPESAPWRDVFLNELSSFPSAAHDDITDSTVQGLNYLRQNSYDGSYFEVLSAFFDGANPAPLDPYLESCKAELPAWHPADDRKGRQCEPNDCNPPLSPSAQILTLRIPLSSGDRMPNLDVLVGVSIVARFVAGSRISTMLRSATEIVRTDSRATNSGDLPTGSLWVKVLPGVGARETVPAGLSRSSSVEWARERLETHWCSRSAWLQLPSGEAIFLRGLN
ncbi:MAG: phage terminase large subunit [Acidobacteriota bacterium]